MLCQLPSSHANGQSMVIYPSSMKHAPSVHRLMTTDVAWLFTPKVCNMLRHLQWSHDNSQIIVIPLTCETRSVGCHRLSMVMYSSGKKHAPSVVIVPRQRSEHGYISLR